MSPSMYPDAVLCVLAVIYCASTAAAEQQAVRGLCGWRAACGIQRRPGGNSPPALAARLAWGASRRLTRRRAQTAT